MPRKHRQSMLRSLEGIGVPRVTSDLSHPTVLQSTFLILVFIRPIIGMNYRCFMVL